MCVVEKSLNGKLFEYCYFLHKEDSLDTICIDPGYDTNHLMRYIEEKNFKVDTILLTHGHFDHMISCKAIQDNFNSKIYVSKEDEEILYDSSKNYAELIRKYEFDKLNITANISDNEMLSILGFDIKCIATPGHTKGGFSFYLEKEKILFSGDTLFFETYGRVDLYGGDFETIKDSIIHKLFLLPDDVVVYPGHGQDTTIGYEKEHNEIFGGV